MAKKIARVISSPRYCVYNAGHVFKNGKFYQAALELVSRGLIERSQIAEPEPPGRDILLLAHTGGWIDKILMGHLSEEDVRKAEHPFDRAISKAHCLSCAGSVMAVKDALETGIGLHAGGGGHHAFRDHGEGFCFLNDIAIGVNYARKFSAVRRAAVIDLDVHQGNGTAAIFGDEKEVFTFSMHQADLFPDTKTGGDLDIEVKAGTAMAAYAALLEEGLARVLDGHKPEFVMYLAGADCCERDRLGGLKLTIADLRRRDEMVFSACLRRHIPVAAALGGGYAQDMRDIVAVHANTLEAALKIFKLTKGR
ncbi:MAG: histone deacetylase [Elusimicrobiaceae bacterium]